MCQELLTFLFLVIFMPFRGLIAILFCPLVILRAHIYIIKHFRTKKKYGWIWQLLYDGIFGSTFMLILYVLLGKEVFDPFSKPTWISEPLSIDVFDIFSITDLKRGSNWF